MDPERYARVSELFQRAVELPGAERRAFLDEACADDEELRREVELLLRHDESSSEGSDVFAESRLQEGGGLVGQLSDVPARSEEEPGAIGTYAVLQVIGEGGMGKVYLCRQEEPIRRQVAVKLIKLGMDSEQILRRFELEREALERMDHPHVARVLDAGKTAEGRPYFAMEYVPGQPIDAYCDARALDLNERLRVFVLVARAIHHAHQRGILHRDVKPNNVLVTEVDGEPVPKVIDFGLARATDPDASRLASRTGQVLGTPAYMSPEQADPSVVDVDLRTDVYSLGVLLYELLTGSLPFEASHRASDASGSAEKPSSRFSTPGEEASRVASRRASSVRGLRRALQGDLDWIVLMAMDPEVGRRYPSASELAADVERYLEGQPVLASPPSLRYRLGKFYGRNRAASWAGTLFVLLLIVSLIVTLRLYDRASDAEAEALSLLDDEQARNDIFSHMLVTADPRNVGKDARVSDLLARGMEYTESKYADNPRVAAGVLQSLGTTFRELGELAEARRCLVRAVELRRELRDENPRELSFAINSLAILNRREGDYAGAERCYRESIELLEGELGEDPDDQRSIAASCYNLARMLIARGKVQEARGPMERALDLQQRYSADDHEVLTFGNAGMAELCSALEQDEEAYGYALASVEHARLAFPDDHPYLATSLMYLAATTTRLGRAEEAEPFYRESLEIARRLYPERSAGLKVYLDRLILHCIQAELFEEADQLLAESAEIAELHHGTESMEVAYTRMLLGQLLLEMGDAEGALQELLPAQEVLHRTNPGADDVLESVDGLVEEARATRGGR